MKIAEVIQKLEKAIRNLKENPKLGDSIYLYKIDISEGATNTYVDWKEK